MLILIVVLKSTDKLVKFNDVIIFKTMKTLNYQILGTKIANEDTEKVVSIPVKQRLIRCFNFHCWSFKLSCSFPFLTFIYIPIGLKIMYSSLMQIEQIE